MNHLHTKEGTTAETHHLVISVHNENVMNIQNVVKWYHEIKERRHNVHDEI